MKHHLDTALTATCIVIAGVCLSAALATCMVIEDLRRVGVK